MPNKCSIGRVWLHRTSCVPYTEGPAKEYTTVIKCEPRGECVGIKWDSCSNGSRLSVILLRAIDMTCLHLSVRKKGGTTSHQAQYFCVCLGWIGLLGPVVYGEGGVCGWTCGPCAIVASEWWDYVRGRGGGTGGGSGGMRGAKMAIAMRSRPSHRENDHREELGHLWTQDWAKGGKPPW